MSLSIFSINSSGVSRLNTARFRLERDLQNLIEANIEVFLDLRFIASEYSTGDHQGRIDTLAIDKDLCPIIIEYKRDRDSNVINQGLFYLNWLLSNKAEYQLLVQDKFGHDASINIDWSGARVICLASSFSKYDKEAVLQINSNIDLVEYSSHENGIMTLDFIISQRIPGYKSGKQTTQKAFIDSIELASNDIQLIYKKLKDRIEDISGEIVLNYSGKYLNLFDLNTESSLARVYLYAENTSLRMEIFGSQYDCDNHNSIRTRKTRNGFEFSIVDDNVMELALMWLSCIHAKLNTFT